jgi:hypothetical protein
MVLCGTAATRILAGRSLGVRRGLTRFLGSLLLVCASAGIAVETADAGGYVTPLFARGLYSGVGPGFVSMDGVKGFLDAREIDGTVSVVTAWPYEHERRVRYGSQIYFSWDDLGALQGDGWTITSHGRTGVKLTSGTSAATKNAEVNGSLSDLVSRGFDHAWSLYSYKNGAGDAYTESLVRASYAYGRGNPSSNMTLPLAKPERARTRTTLGGHCNDSSLPCYRIGSNPYLMPSKFITALNAMTANQWTMLESFFFVEGAASTDTIKFDCTGPVSQHWTRDAGGGRELYCWNDYQAIIQGISATYESPYTIAQLYGRAK